MKKHFSPLAAKRCILMLAAVISLASCREDAIIKSSLTPAVDNIHTFGIGPDFNNGSDTITLETGTAFQDSVNTSSRTTGFPIYHTLGWMRDPFAGTTAASIYAQFVPTTTGVTFAGVTPDSVVLVLPYSGFTWGDTTVSSTHQIKVYSISEGFSKDSIFYSYSSRATGATPIGTATLVTGLSGTGVIQDSVTLGVNRYKYAPHLRVKLDASWVQNVFLPAISYDTSYTAFLQQFAGLCITADTSGLPGRTLPYFLLNGASTVYGSAALLAYVSGNDTAPVQFPYIATYAAHFNRIRRNYNGAPIASVLGPGNQAYLAMQNGPGAAFDIRMPYIQSLFKKIPAGAIINKAELCFTVTTAPGQTPADDARFFPPYRLYPQGVNATGGLYTIADRYPVQDATLNFIDGTSSTVTRNGTTQTVYRINIPREMQQIIVGGLSGLHLRIGGTVNFPAAYRLVVAGTGNTTAAIRPTINIIYTKQ